MEVPTRPRIECILSMACTTQILSTIAQSSLPPRPWEVLPLPLATPSWGRAQVWPPCCHQPPRPRRALRTSCWGSMRRACRAQGCAQRGTPAVMKKREWWRRGWKASDGERSGEGLRDGEWHSAMDKKGGDKV
eukprot:356735-Chlamydomonas_euryale.AAC.3